MLSKLFRRHRSIKPGYVQYLFLGLLVLFVVVAQVKPVIGLVGVGTLAILAAGVVELNSQRIWDEYRKNYKKQRRFTGIWHEPKVIYFNLNIYVLWPLVALLGALCLWAAYVLV